MMAHRDNQEDDGPGNIPVDGAPRKPKKLVLCFDGTGNAFTGSNADTNVVKLFSKLDRADPDQFHYYQTGIGTYDPESTSVDKSWLETTRDGIASAMDQGFGSGFDSHVIAGYRFLMRYYSSGDKIYMFGFSRGAYTAKFLARMIHTVGLLCRGNEEMVPFAYRLYRRYLAGEIQEFSTGRGGKKAEKDQQPSASTPMTPLSPLSPASNGDPQGMANGTSAKCQAAAAATSVNTTNKDPTRRDEIEVFSSTFCRKEQVSDKHGNVTEGNIKVYFLGMWDCVNSVAVLEQKTPIPVPVKGTARYVRHAVAVDERRVKFKPALLAQDIRDTEKIPDEDIKEVWFPGGHGDVGGGYPASKESPLDMRKKMSFGQRVKNVFTTRKGKAAKHLDSGPLQLSDIPLAWMIREVELVGQQGEAGTVAAVKWCDKRMEAYKKRINEPKRKEQALKGFIHDSLSFGCGKGFFKVLFWKFLEYLPIITRWELVNNKWENVRFPLNSGASRDIPHDAWFHDSLLQRLRNDPEYRPKNNHGDGGVREPCLKYGGVVPEFELVPQVGPDDKDHRVYTIVKGGTA